MLDAAKGLVCSSCGDAFDGPERDCPAPSPGRPLVDCGRGGHMFDARIPRGGEFDLAAALDGLMAYDTGATDSGVKDEALRKRVREHLHGMPDGEMMATLSRYAREHFLAESALANGRSIADVAEFVRWLSDRMDIDV